MIKTAKLSDCGTYRYHLGRRWDEALPSLTFIMLNPSTADADLDDPTIRRCIAFARREGCGGVDVVNLFALRSTDPKALFRHANPGGPNNNGYLFGRISAAALGNTRIVCAWGAHKAAHWQVNRLQNMLYEERQETYCLGRTKGGHPRHPLYVRADQPLEVYIKP